MIISNMLDTVKQEVNEKLTKALAKQDEQEVHLVLYTDGGCDNTGDKIGGWGVHGYYYNDKATKSNSGCKGYTPTKDGYVVTKTEDKVNVLAYLDFFGGLVTPTTNNVAELHALAAAFEITLMYPVASVTIYMDSDYVRRGLTEYLPNWTRNNWLNSKGQPVANKEYWVELSYLLSEIDTLCLNTDSVRLRRVDGHSGDKGNDKADELATAGAWGIRNYPAINSECFRMESPAVWFSDKTLSKLFTEGRLFFNQMAIHENGNFYYQSNLPYAGTELNRERMIGKRVSDLTMSVIKLNQPEHVLDAVMNYVIGHRQMTGIFKSRLDLLAKVDNYQHLELYPDGRYLVYNDAKGDVHFPNKSSSEEARASIITVIHQPRLAYNIFGEYDVLREVLISYLNNDSKYSLVSIDITHYMYQTNLKNKKSVDLIYKFDSNVEDNLIIPVALDDVPTFNINLTFGIGIPSKISMARFKDVNPKIFLLIDKTSDSYITHYVVIQTDEGIGIWTAPYANEILLAAPKKE